MECIQTLLLQNHHDLHFLREICTLVASGACSRSLKHQRNTLRRDQEMKSQLPNKLPERSIYVEEPKTPENPESWKDKAVKGINQAKEKATDLYKDSAEKYGEAFGGRSLGKDAAIAAGATAALGLGIHAIRKHNKKKKASKDQIESKYKTKK